MGRRRSERDWYSFVRSYFKPGDGAVDAGSSGSPAAAPQAPATTGAAAAAATTQAPALDVVVTASSDDERRFGPDDVEVDGGAHFQLNRPAAAKDAVGLGLDVPFARKRTDDFSPVDEDEEGDEHVSHEHCSKKNNDKLPLNKRKSQGHGGRRKPCVNKRRAHASDAEESDYESSLPSRFPKRRNQLQNSSFVHSGKAQDAVVLDDEYVEPREEVNCEMSGRLSEQKIYYPSRDDQEAAVLTRSDIKCLDPEGFLSSEVINFYLEYIKRTRLSKEIFGDKFYIFNTFFFGKLEKALYQPRDFPKLRRWWKGVNIFNNAYIILPVHAKEHWSLVIICLPPTQRPSEPIILHLDSLGMHSSTKILNTVERYLETEWDFLSVVEAAWPCLLCDVRKETVQVPQQNNAYDCGIFMLYYIEQFIKAAPARFTADKLDMFSRSWFEPEEASGLRWRIRELLLEKFESARLDDHISKANASKGYDSIKDGELEADDSSKMVVEVGVGFENTEKEGKPIVIASPKRLKGNEESIGSTPIPDVVCDSGVKRLEGNEFNGVLDDEDVEPKEEVNREISDRPNEQMIYYPSRDDQEAVVLTRSDIKCLDAEGFLSSEVINFYLEYIKRTILSKENFRGKFYIFNTFFFGKLEKALYEPRGFPKLRGWWKGVNIFNNAYIILPVHAKEHWSLVIICLPPKERPSEPIILHLDSLGMHRSTKILNTVERYLETEWDFLSVVEAAWPCLLSDVRKETVQVPQQNNPYDSGIFMLCYIEQFIKAAPARFTTDKLDMFSHSWFEPEEASGLRQRIRELLLEKIESATLDDPISKANASKGYDIIKDGELEADDGSKMVVEVGVGFRNTEKEGKPIVIASPERLKGNEEAMGSTPIPDVVRDNGVKRLEGNEELNGSMATPDAVCEITGTKLWITRVYRPPITLPLDNWYRSRGGSSRDDRRAFIEQFCRRNKN